MTQTAILAKNDAQTRTASANSGQGTRFDSSGNVIADPSWSFRNVLINGSMRVAQRGSTYPLTTAAGYGSIDRWAAYQPTSADGVFNQVSGSNGFQYFAKLGRNNGSSVTNNLYMLQVLETTNSIPLQGKTVTLSFYAKAGTNFSAASSILKAQIYSGTGTDQSSSTLSSWTGITTVASQDTTISTSLVRYSVTGTVSAYATQVAVQFYYTPTGTAGVDDNVYITGVQLEVGSVATPFEVRPYQMELALCQRYLPYFSSSTSSVFAPSYNYTTTNSGVTVTFPVSTRIPPTSVVASSANILTIYSGGSGIAGTAITFSNATSLASLLNVTISGITTGYAGQANFNAAGYIYFTGCEL